MRRSLGIISGAFALRSRAFALIGHLVFSFLAAILAAIGPGKIAWHPFFAIIRIKVPIIFSQFSMSTSNESADLKQNPPSTRVISAIIFLALVALIVGAVYF